MGVRLRQSKQNYTLRHLSNLQDLDIDDFDIEMQEALARTFFLPCG